MGAEQQRLVGPEVMSDRPMRPTRWKALILAALAFSALHCSGSNNGDGAGYNVILLTLDTTRADHLGCYGDKDAVTPALDALAANGTVFDRAYAPSPLTLPSHTTMLTGLNPNEHGLSLNNKASLSADVPTLATILAQHKYRNAAFIAAPVLDSQFGLDRGFEVYDDAMRGAVSMANKIFYRPANVVVDLALDWLRQHTERRGSSALEKRSSDTPNLQPFFLWIHLYDPHPPLYGHEDLNDTKVTGEATYEGEIAFMDRHIGRITAALEAAQLSERTLIIAVGDHGEELGDHGDPSHGLDLYQEVLRVPFIVALPGVVQVGHRVDAVVSLRDLLPTVLDVLGLPPARQGGGRTLSAALQGQRIDPQASYAETETPYSLYRWSPLHSLTTGQWKYIRTARPELYDHERDPAEMYNLATVFPERVADLERDLAAYETSSSKVSTAKSVQLSEADRQRMRDLGYLVGQDAPSEGIPKLDLLDLRDVKDALRLRIWDWTIRWGIDVSTVAPETVVTVARELLRQSPESPGFQSMLESALRDMGQPLDESLPERDVNAIRIRNEGAERIVAPFRLDLKDPAKRAKAHSEVGLALAKGGFLDDALGHYSELARLEPDNFLVQTYMAQLFRALERPKQTILHLKRAVELRPQDAGAQYNLALVYTEGKDYENAAQHYRNAIAAKPDYAEARNNLAYVLTRLDKPREAEELLREALRANPSLAPAHANLAELLVKERRYGEAVAEYDLLLQLNPGDTQSATKLALLLATCDDQTRRDPARALELATSAVAATREKGPMALVALARAHAATGNYEAATRAAQKALPHAVFGRRDDLVEEIEKDLLHYRQAAATSGGKGNP